MTISILWQSLMTTRLVTDGGVAGMGGGGREEAPRMREGEGERQAEHAVGQRRQSAQSDALSKEQRAPEMTVSMQSIAPPPEYSAVGIIRISNTTASQTQMESIWKGTIRQRTVITLYSRWHDDGHGQEGMPQLE
jgi:hypothetical protein